MRPIVVVEAWSAYLFVTSGNRAKTVEPIEMAFGVWPRVSPENHEFGGVRIPHHPPSGGSVTEWLACWTQAQKGPGSNCSRDAVG